MNLVEAMIGKYRHTDKKYCNQSLDLTTKIKRASLAGFCGNDSDAFMREISNEIRRIVASSYAKYRFLDDLSETVLFNEAFLKSDGFKSLPIENRLKFFGALANVVKNVIIDHIRASNALKRNAELSSYDDGHQCEPFSGQAAPNNGDHNHQISKLETALERIRDDDAELYSLVSLKFFCGFSWADIADKTGISERTLNRKWRYARAKLKIEMQK